MKSECKPHSLAIFKPKYPRYPQSYQQDGDTFTTVLMLRAVRSRRGNHHDAAARRRRSWDLGARPALGSVSAAALALGHRRLSARQYAVVHLVRARHPERAPEALTSAGRRQGGIEPRHSRLNGPRRGWVPSTGIIVGAVHESSSRVSVRGSGQRCAAMCRNNSAIPSVTPRHPCGCLLLPPPIGPPRSRFAPWPYLSERRARSARTGSAEQSHEVRNTAPRCCAPPALNTP
jgi:hypothetical protein